MGSGFGSLIVAPSWNAQIVPAKEGVEGGCKKERVPQSTMSEANGDYEARNARTRTKIRRRVVRPVEYKLGNRCSPALLAQVSYPGGIARETEISPVQSRRSLGFYKIRKYGAPVKRGCRGTNYVLVCAMDVPDR